MYVRARSEARLQMARRPRSNGTENFLAAALDRKDFMGTLLGEISEQILPVLSQALKEGWDRDKLMSHPKIELLMSARQATIAILEPDSAKALAAIKDAVDRRHGKPTEKIEQTHRLEKLPDEQLDSMLISRLRQSDTDTDDEDMPN